MILELPIYKPSELNFYSKTIADFVQLGWTNKIYLPIRTNKVALDFVRKYYTRVNVVYLSTSKAPIDKFEDKISKLVPSIFDYHQTYGLDSLYYYIQQGKKPSLIICNFPDVFLGGGLFDELSRVCRILQIDDGSITDNLRSFDAVYICYHDSLSTNGYFLVAEKYRYENITHGVHLNEKFEIL